MKIFLDSVGCRLNQSEIEKLALQFRSTGHQIVADPKIADIVVVNTCAVTAEAASDSKQKIRQAYRAGEAAIVATGCWATLDPQRAAELPAVKWVIGNSDKAQLVAQVLQIPTESIHLDSLDRYPLPGGHMRTRAFIKVQDGCDNFCTYCATRLVRGQGKSVSTAEIMDDVTRALRSGTKEIVLTGVHLGSWGQDLSPRQRLQDLVESILIRTENFRLRLSSLEPWDLEERFFELWKDTRMCRHLHLPLQAGSAATLRRMGRKVTPDSFAWLVNTARAAIPEVAITTDLIAGFPGETQEEFNESIDFIQRLCFSGGHVFTYSPRPGTPAASYPEQVPPFVRKQRSQALRQILADSGRNYRTGFIGKVTTVLWESSRQLSEKDWVLEGLTDNYLRVTAASVTKKWNEFDLVKLNGLEEEGLTGTILKKSD